jgi:hypothetical protein
MPKLRLAAVDRERLGCPELLDSSIASMTNREAMELQKIGYPTPGLLAAALRAGGAETDFRAITALVWLALRRAGVQVEFDTLEFNLNDLESVPDPEPEPVVSEGKAPGREVSTNSPRKRSTSTGTSRRRSTSTGSRS